LRSAAQLSAAIHTHADLQHVRVVPTMAIISNTCAVANAAKAATG
jgi:hypothetical protein